MCVNTRLVRNRWTGRTIRVACGRCPACKQAKAAQRANRIRNSSRHGWVALFVTLTYANEFVPYVYRHQLGIDKIVPIHRDSSARLLKNGKFKFYDETRIIDSLEYEMDDFGVSLSQLRDLKNYYGRIGVCYYPDLQDFLKRFRNNLYRHYELQFPLSYFACSEYGGKSYRPHFHLLLFVPTSYVNEAKSCIYESWAYDYRGTKRMSVEIARNAASYVSSYVNSTSAFPSFLQTSDIKQKHSYSKNFGVYLECFSLASILEKTDKRDLHYYREVVKDGVPSVHAFTIPKYVINRYFPKFKGYFRFAPSEIPLVLRFPQRLRNEFIDGFRCNYVYRPRQGVSRCVNINHHWSSSNIAYNEEDLHEYSVRMRNAIDYYISVTGKTEYDFAIDYVRVWNLFDSTLLHDSFFDSEGNMCNFSYHYENINDLDFGIVHSDLKVDDTFVRDANLRNDIVIKTHNLYDLYKKMTKNKNIVNLALSESGYNV